MTGTTLPLNRFAQVRSYLRQQHGMTLIEIIIVISIMGVIYSVAMPQFSLITGADTAEHLGLLSSDIRAAFDMAVLQRKPYRLVFELQSGAYWLEVADREVILMPDQKQLSDPTADEEKGEENAFDESFVEYSELAGKEYREANGDRKLAPFSPVLQAKDLLKPIQWSKVESGEWKRRSLGNILAIKSFQAEHHIEKQELEKLGENARAMLYVFPQGYLEQCVIVIAGRLGQGQIDPESTHYTVRCNPSEGIATVEGGEQDTEIKDGERD